MGDHNEEEDVRSVPVPLKSRNSHVPAFVSFINSTSRVANVIWINFNGQKKSYTANGLDPGGRLDIRTYCGHPWIARDFQTGDNLEFIEPGGGSVVYMPEKVDGTRNYRAPRVRVRVPVYSMYERSLQVVRKLVRNTDDVDDLEIPKQIKYDLRQDRDIAPLGD